MAKSLVLYLPVLHQGYISFFQRHSDARRCLVLDLKTLPPEFSPQRDIRALSAEAAIGALEGWQASAVAHGVLAKPFEVSPGAPVTLEYLAFCHRQTATPIVMPEDNITRALKEIYFKDCSVVFDSAFLRWDMGRSTTENQIETATVITNTELDRGIMTRAAELATRSADWWRQVAAIAVKDGQVLFEAFNQHRPNELQPYYDGDPRADFDRGVRIELSTAIHAEAALIAQAAKLGQSLKDADLFVTVFPCPPCARLVAAAGFKRLYFSTGYSLLDGQEVLKSADIEIIRVV